MTHCVALMHALHGVNQRISFFGHTDDEKRCDGGTGLLTSGVGFVALLHAPLGEAECPAIAATDV
jgi:hypothetical protein